MWLLLQQHPDDDDDDNVISDDDVPSDIDLNDPYFREELDSIKGISYFKTFTSLSGSQTASIKCNGMDLG